MSAEPKPIADMSEIEVAAIARQKLRELCIHDLKFWMNQYCTVSPGVTATGGLPDYRATCDHISQLLSQLAQSEGV